MEKETQHQELTQTPVTSPEREGVPSRIPKKRLFLILAIVILILLILGGLYGYQKMRDSSSTLESSPTKSVQINTEKKESLNPNSGNLYGDIKIRMKEVLK